jgi:hypothetical protein
MMLLLLPLAFFTVVSLDGNSTRRMVVLALAAAAAAAFVLIQQRQPRHPSKHAIDGLPRTLISDPLVYGLDRAPAKYARLRRNARVLSVIDGLAPLRAYDAHAFAIACAYAETLLARAAKRPARLDQLVLLKNRVLDTFQELAIAVPPRTLSRLDVPEVLKALDTVLFTEAIARHGRVQDVYPLAASDDAMPHQVHGAA